MLEIVTDNLLTKDDRPQNILTYKDKPMNTFSPRDPQFKQKVTDSFLSQEVMKAIGAEATVIEPGHVEILFKYDKKIT